MFEQFISSSNVGNGVSQHDDDNSQSHLEKDGKKEARTEEEIEEEEEDKFNKNDPIQRQKFNDLKPTMFVNDFPQLNKEIELNNERLKNQVNEKVNKIFDKLRNEELGNIKNEKKKEEIEMIRELTKFADMWISVSLLNPRTKKEQRNLIVTLVQGNHVTNIVRTAEWDIPDSPY